MSVRGFVLRYCLFFFFFKQKTAYEFRISDWISDVCSSDLRPAGWPAEHTRRVPESVSKTTTHSEMNSSTRSSADIWELSSSMACAGSRYWRRNTRSRYLAWNAVMDASMPWPVTDRQRVV